MYTCTSDLAKVSLVFASRLCYVTCIIKAALPLSMIKRRTHFVIGHFCFVQHFLQLHLDSPLIPFHLTILFSNHYLPSESVKTFWVKCKDITKPLPSVIASLKGKLQWQLCDQLLVVHLHNISNWQLEGPNKCFFKKSYIISFYPPRQYQTSNLRALYHMPWLSTRRQSKLARMETFLTCSSMKKVN